MNKPIVISYYTRGTCYEKEAASLKASCDKWNWPSVIEGIESFGKWHEHTCYKPLYILQKMKELKRPLIWLDADAEMAREPLLFSQIDSDLALRFYENYPPDHPSYAYAGTIYFNHSSAALSFVEAWAEECQKALREGLFTVDQQILGRLLLTKKVKVAALPRGYAAIFEEEMPEKEKIIIQYQASRLYKKVIDGELSFGILDHLSVEELRSLRPRVCLAPLEGENQNEDA